jgi:phosphinothricin acetyltransferase
MDLTIRPVEERDRFAVRDIFNHYATHGFAVYREDESDDGIFDFFARDAVAFLVADHPADGVVGFGTLRRFKPASAFDATAVLSYFILPEHTGTGLGTRFLAELEAAARERGIVNLLAHISSRNAQSLAFHRKHGFAEVGRLHDVGRKFGRLFDVVWTQKILGDGS